VQPEDVSALDEGGPAVEMSQVRLTSDLPAQPVQVPLHGRAPLLQADPVETGGELAMQPPREALRTCQVGFDRSSHHLESIPHAGQQPLQLLVTQLDLAGQELTDARLMHPTEPRQLRLGDAQPAAEPIAIEANIDEYMEAGFAWPTDQQGNQLASTLLKLRPQDMAALGQLFLDNGRWRGRQVVPTAWVREATASHTPAQGAGDGYGYLWWVGTADGDAAYRAYG